MGKRNGFSSLYPFHLRSLPVGTSAGRAKHRATTAYQCISHGGRSRWWAHSVLVLVGGGNAGKATQRFMMFLF